ncbi:MAG TPA: hypothetical protein VGB98_18010 [Pyrinomonadaceae bacterium]|jgi:hypothetical protein
MNDYLGNLIARSRNTTAALRPQFAHPYETLDGRSAPVAAPYPEERAQGLPTGEHDGVPSARTEAPVEAASPVQNGADELRRSGERHGSESASRQRRQVARRGNQRSRPSEESTSGNPLRPSTEMRPQSETQTGTPVIEPNPGAAAGPRSTPETPLSAQARAPQGPAPVRPARPQAAPPDARQTRRTDSSDVSFLHSATDAEADARVFRAEASLAPTTTSLAPTINDAPADARAPLSAGQSATSRPDEKALPLLVNSAPAAPDLIRLSVPEPPAPVIRVTIGRVEVRAVTSPTPAPARKPVRPTPRMSLDEYLRSQNGGRG